MENKTFLLSKRFEVDQVVNDIHLIESVSETVLELANAAIMNNKTSQFLYDFLAIADSFEKTSNILLLNEMHNKKCFLFGKIVSLYELISTIHKEKQDCDSFNHLIHSYPLLLPILHEINKRGTISGVQLKKALSMHSSSGLSNFLQRIKKYDLISVRKIGNINYYSLTARGKEALNSSKQIDANNANNGNTISVDNLYRLLAELSIELGKIKPNKLSILETQYSLTIKEKQLLKREIDKVFIARDMYRKNLFGYAGEAEDDLSIEATVDNLSVYYIDTKSDEEELYRV